MILICYNTNTFENQYLAIAPKGLKGEGIYNNFFENNKTKISSC